MTGDTAKILVLTLERVCTFTLRLNHPNILYTLGAFGKGEIETRPLGGEIQLYQPDSMLLQFCYHPMSDNKMNPHNLLILGRAHITSRLHWKLTKTEMTYKSLCSWVAVHISFSHQARYNPPRGLIKVVSF